MTGTQLEKDKDS